MSPRIQTCPLCGWDAQTADIAYRDATQIACDVCGKFIITRTLLVNISAFDDAEKGLLPYLSAHIRQANEQGIATELNTGNWKALAQSQISTPISQKLNKVL